MTEKNEDIDKLRTMIEEAKRGVVFTGAGISTESGIPDFRSPGGIWTTNQPIMFQDFMASEESRREAWRRQFNTRDVIRKAQPNNGHLAVSKLVRIGKVSSVITQNIDSLHQRAGVPEEKIIELHGNATYARCLTCGRRYELDDIQKAFERDGALPVCRYCDGIIKTATISFGQPMPEEAMWKAEQETLSCDLFLAFGSSLVVYPAAGFPELAKRNNARLVIVNRDPTTMDAIADLVIHENIGKTLSEAVGLD